MKLKVVEARIKPDMNMEIELENGDKLNMETGEIIKNKE